MATINGTSGNDSLTGTSGNDTISGFGGNDLILAGSTGGADVIDGGTGFDSIEFKERATSAVVVDFVAGTISGGSSGTISFTNIERVVGGNFHDQMTGNNAGQTLTGQAGADTLWGAGGIDTLWGGTGADTFIFRETGTGNADLVRDWASGSDKLLLDGAVMSALGAAGNFAAGDARFWAAAGANGGHDADDRIVYNTTTRQIFYDADGSGAGAAQLVATLQTGATLAATDIVATGPSGPNQGTDGNDTLIGGPGSDSMNGFAGNDDLSGWGGDDTLIGGDGDDSLNGGVGHDRLEGGAGSDFLLHAIWDNDTLDGGTGSDILWLRNADTAVTVDLAAGTMVGGDAAGTATATVLNIEWVDAGELTQSVHLIGTNNNDLLRGGTRADRIFGGAGDDMVYGSAFEANANGDELHGGAGNDVVSAFGGHGSLDGGPGNDVLAGGDGIDDFVFSAAPGEANWDHVAFFAAGTDKLVLDGDAFPEAGPSGSFSSGDDRFASYINLGPPSATPGGFDAEDRILYNIDTGEVWYDPDGSGSRAAQRIATLQDAPALTATDIAVDEVTEPAGGQVINGSAGNDSLAGDAGNDTIAGLGGNDTIAGNGGNDSLDGGNDIDSLIGGVGNDTLTGGTSRDRFLFAEAPGTANADLITDFAVPSQVIGAPTPDSLVFDGSIFTRIGSTSFVSSDARLFAGPGATSGQDSSDRLVYNTSTGQLFYDADGNGHGASQIVATLQGAPNLDGAQIEVINGQPDPDGGGSGGVVIDGTSGNDTLTGTSGNDTINGLGGNDLFLAGSSGGADVINGGTGFDSIEFKHRATSGVVVDFAAGTITGGSSGTISFTSVERAVGGNFNDQMIGNGAGQTLTGQAGADTLWGAGGIDTLWGGGGAGDTFIFREMGSANADRVSDFTSAVDKIGLDDSAFTAIGASGNFSTGDARFAAGAGFTSGRDASDRVIYNTSTGSLYYDADGSGAGTAQLIATLAGNPAVAATDIVVI